jgi:hypothetical protein
MPTNKGETYCCSIKNIKSFFSDTEARVCFDSSGKFCARIYHVESYVRKKINGKIACKITMNTRSQYPSIVFYAVKENEYPDELRQEFITLYLPQIYAFYKKHHEDQSLVCRETLMLVEIFDKKLIIHKINTGRN